MTRLRVTIPASRPLFTTKIPIRITDINYGNHLGNDAIVSILHESRVQFLHQDGLSELDAGGVGLILANLTINYKSQSYYGDVLDIEIYAEINSKLSFDLLYKVTTQRENKNILIALANTTMAGYNYASGKMASLSNQLLEMLKK